MSGLSVSSELLLSLQAIKQVDSSNAVHKRQSVAQVCLVSFFIIVIVVLISAVALRLTKRQIFCKNTKKTVTPLPENPFFYNGSKIEKIIRTFLCVIP